MRRLNIQVAIDRVDVDEMLRIGECVYGIADIVEIGTSLIKDYGLAASVGVMRKHFPDMKILADLKTCDEGAYEFEKAFEAGADIATVMGFSSDATISACASAAKKYGKQVFIDLLEVLDARLAVLTEKFPEAVFGIHLPADMHGEGLTDLVADTCGHLDKVKMIAAAGGIKLENMAFLKEAAIDIAIIGSAVTKEADIIAAARAFVSAAQR